MALRQTIEDHPAIIFLGAIVVGFLAGGGTYKWVLDNSGKYLDLDTVDKRYVKREDYDALKRKYDEELTKQPTKEIDQQAAPPPPKETGIAIDKATYGLENVVDVTSTVSKLCNKKSSCSFRVDPPTLETQDLSPYKTKLLLIIWSCGTTGMPLRKANDFETVDLSCR
ncbi:MAG: hypothetical protein ABTQ93_07690 [Candidatus Competibacter denitrificans]